MNDNTYREVRTGNAGIGPAEVPVCAGAAPQPVYGGSPYGELRAAEKEPFSANQAEMVFSLLSYIAAYCYVLFLTGDSEISSPGYLLQGRLCLAAVAAFIVSAGFVLSRYGTGMEPGPEGERARKRPASPENFVWLGCFICCLAGFYIHFALIPSEIADPVTGEIYIWNSDWLEGVWDKGQVLLFIHIFAVWWMLSQSGALIEGRSGRLLPADAFNGFLAIPFGNIILRIRTWVFGLKALFSRREGAKKRGFSLRSAAAVAACVALLATSVSLLGSADSNFGKLLGDLKDIIHIDVDGLLVVRLMLSIPVGAWLYGLAAGCARKKAGDLEGQKDLIYKGLASLRGVPAKLWIFAVGAFTLVYAAFFMLQASYLFGGFSGRLPEGFVYSEYAREGFFELCRVMLVNFALLWLVTRMAKAEEEGSRLLRALCLVVLAESVIFAVIALSKLGLYISVYGFTPLRLQSSWLVCVLLCGCLLWAWSILTGKPTFRKWMYFGAVSLSLLTLY